MAKVVVAGASFAGLAVAAQLRENALLLDWQPVGEGQTSACGAPLAAVSAWAGEDVVEQVHPTLTLHTRFGTHVYRLCEPYCTFDYAAFCRELLRRSGAQFFLARCTGRDGATVHTSAGDFEAEYLVDASGWRAVLADTPARKRRPHLSFGIETSVPRRTEGLHFYVNPRYVRRGYAWAFGAGERTRCGVISYGGNTQLTGNLRAFLADLGERPGELHGGFCTARLRRPVRDGVFAVGDAAGHAFGLTGEGIRSALYFGGALGGLLHRACAGELTAGEAKRAYADLTYVHRWGFNFYSVSQAVVANLPNLGVELLAEVLEWKTCFELVEEGYRETANGR
jgi:menaquinone-9 beta-reductase